MKSILPNLLNPSFALIANTIPGFGMLYAGKPVKALKTLIANIIGIYGTLYSIKNSHYVDAFLWVFFWENRFYFGSFQNTLEDVWEENAKRLKPYFYYIRKRLEKGGKNGHL